MHGTCKGVTRISKIYRFSTYVPITAILDMNAVGKPPDSSKSHLLRPLQDCMLSIEPRRRVLPFGYKHLYMVSLSADKRTDDVKMHFFTGRQFLIRHDGGFVKVKYLKKGDTVLIRQPETGIISYNEVIDIAPNVVYSPVAEVLVTDKEPFSTDGVLNVALSKVCKKSRPVISYGIILYHLDETSRDAKYLIVRRRHSMAFLDFIRGKYFNMDRDYMCKLYLTQVTAFERELLQSKTFDELWCYVWNTSAKESPSSKYHQQYLKSKRRWYDLNLKDLFESVAVQPFQTPEYGWPKGRSLKNEAPLDTALREFNEETGLVIDQSNATLDQATIDEPLEESFQGDNGVRYSHFYILARLTCVPPFETCNTPLSNGEIGAVEFRRFEDCLRAFRPDAVAKKQLLTVVHLRVSNLLSQSQ